MWMWIVTRGSCLVEDSQLMSSEVNLRVFPLVLYTSSPVGPNKNVNEVFVVGYPYIHLA